MRAAVVTDFHSPLETQDLPVPEPGPGEVLVRMDNAALNRPIFAPVLSSKTVIRSIVGTRNDLADVINLHAARWTGWWPSTASSTK